MKPQRIEPTPDSPDGRGGGDHDLVYVFGRVPRAATPFPFSTREFARLMVVRSRFRAGLAYSGDTPEMPK